MPTAATALATPTSASLARERWVITAVFFAFAIGFGLWAGAIPHMMRRTGVGQGELGVSLALHSAAYIGAMAACGHFARWLGPRRVILAVLPLHAAGFWLLFGASSPLTLSVGLVAIGLSGGTVDLAMNAEGASVERRMGRPVLTRMHAAASGAFALGALAGSLLAEGWGARACAVLVLAVMLPVMVTLSRLPTPDQATLPSTAVVTRAWVSRSVALLGIILGLSVAAEMSAQMWSATLLEAQAADLAALAGAGAALFAGSQAVVRWFGDPLRQRLGDWRLITHSLALAAAGAAVVAASPWFVLSLLGFALVGLGTACIVPCCFALAARHVPEHAAANLSMASLIAGTLRLPAPLVLGAVAATWSSAAAFMCIVVAMLAGLTLVHVARRR